MVSTTQTRAIAITREPASEHPHERFVSGLFRFPRAETTTTNLDSRYAIEVLGIFLNQGATHGVAGDPNDPLGVVQIGGTHETFNTGPQRIRINDYVYCFPSAYSNSELPGPAVATMKDASGRPYASHRSVIKVHGGSIFKLYLQTIPLASCNVHFNMMSLRHKYRGVVDDLFTEEDGKAAAGSTSSLARIKSQLKGKMDGVDTELGLTGFGFFCGYRHFVAVDTRHYLYSRIRELYGHEKGLETPYQDLMQEAYKLLVTALQACYQDSAMTSGDVDRWESAMAKNAPIDLSPQFLSSMKNVWHKQAPGQSKGFTYGGNAERAADYALLRCSATVAYENSNYLLSADDAYHLILCLFSKPRSLPVSLSFSLSLTVAGPCRRRALGQVSQ